MLNFKSKSLTDQELIQQLKSIIASCDLEDYKTKKFVGLLHDYIPYNNGLKTRLELIGKLGYMEALLKLNKDAESNSKKIERFSVQIASEYGFEPEVLMRTFNLVAQSVGIPISRTTQKPSSQGSVLITNAVRGNFSKNHRRETNVHVTEASANTNISRPVKETAYTEPQRSPRRRWLRNKGNLAKLLFFIVALICGDLYLNTYFNNSANAVLALKEAVSVWWPVIVISSAVISGITSICYRKFKMNLAHFLPIIILIVQLIGIVLKVEVPNLYETIQMVMLNIMILSFILTSGYSIRLPKGAKDFISHKAIYSYYAAGILFLLGQYLVRVSV